MAGNLADLETQCFWMDVVRTESRSRSSRNIQMHAIIWWIMHDSPIILRTWELDGTCVVSGNHNELAVEVQPPTRPMSWRLDGNSALG